MPVENIAIDIFNSDTYENVYSEFSSNATTFYINLSSEEKGNYAIEIEVDGVHFTGSFSL